MISAYLNQFYSPRDLPKISKFSTKFSRDQIQIASGIFNCQSVRIILVFFAPEFFKIKKVQIYTTTRAFLDLRCQRDSKARLDFAVFIFSTRKRDVRQMRGDAQIRFEFAGPGDQIFYFSIGA